ncbi:MAG: two-component system response regulator [Planctomyces sp.]|nr:two-component system response regulator [Planctomyces sp.]
MNVLIVDDSEMTRMVAKKTLKALGIENIHEAADGQIAIELFKANPVDVVFSDWNMPNMSGLELLKEIRAINTTVPVIMITTEGSRGKVMEAIQHGVSDYLVKPFTPVGLREKLAKWVQTTV